MNSGFILALVAALGYGITTIIYKFASQSVDPLTQSLVVSLFTTFTLLTLCGFSYLFGHNFQLNEQGVKLSAAGGLVAGMSLVAYITSVSKGDAGISATLRNFSFLVTIILSFIFLSEKITLIKTMGIILALFSLVFLSR